MVKHKETHEEIVTAHRRPSETVTGEERQEIVTFCLGSIFGRVPFPHSAKYLKKKNGIFIFRGIIMDGFSWNTSDFYNAVSILETLLKVVC